MSLTFKIVLDKRHLKKNNNYPLKIRIYQNEAYKEASINIDLAENDWNSQHQIVLSTNPSHKLFNSKITSLKAKVQKYIFLTEDENDNLIITPTEILKKIKKLDSEKNIITKPDLIIFGKEHIAKLKKSGKIGNSIVYNCSIRKLEEYTKKTKLTFESVDYKFLENFNNTMLSEGIRVNTISLYLRSIRALFNKAIKEGILEAKYYPFTTFKIKNEKTISRALTLDEMRAIVNADLPKNSKIWHHRNLFLLSFYFIGINFSDLLTLKKENFVDNRLVFRRKKTHKIYSIKILPKAREILTHYFIELPNCPKQFILPFVVNNSNLITLNNDLTQAIKNTNDYLKKIAKNCEIPKVVTTYYARYTWANIAKSLGYPKDMIAEALGHEYGNKVTGIYLDNYDNIVIDNMNQKVIESVTCKNPKKLRIKSNYHN